MGGGTAGEGTFKTTSRRYGQEGKGTGGVEEEGEDATPTTPS